MDIVTFQPDMQSAVNDFFTKCFAFLGRSYSPMDRHADIANIEQHYMHDGCFWCVFDDKKLIGTVAIHTILDEKTAELKRMYVLPEYQGKGYGRLLLEHAIAQARQKQYQKIYLDTRRQFTVAQSLYRSCGFVETESYNNSKHADLYFELIL